MLGLPHRGIAGPPPLVQDLVDRYLHRLAEGPVDAGLRQLGLGLRQLDVLQHRVEADLQVLGADLAAALVEALPPESRQLGPLHALANIRRLVAGQEAADIGVVRGVVELGATVPLDQLDAGVGIGRGDLDEGVDATGPQHRRVDLVGSVGGQHDDQLTPLRVHPVDDVEDGVHPDGPLLALDHAVDVLRHDHGRLEEAAEPDRLRQVLHGVDGDVGPAVLLALLAHATEQHGLADAVGAGEEDAALAGDAGVAEALRVLHGLVQRVVDGVLDVLREDQLLQLDGAGVDELRGRVGKIALLDVLVVLELDPEGLALVDRVVLEVLAGLLDQLDHLELVLLAALAVEGQADLTAVGAVGGAGRQLRVLDAGDEHAAPGNLHVVVLAGAGRHRDQLGRVDVRAEEAGRDDLPEVHPAVDLVDGGPERQHAVQRVADQLLVQLDQRLPLARHPGEVLHDLLVGPANDRHVLLDGGLGERLRHVDRQQTLVLGFLAGVNHVLHVILGLRWGHTVSFSGCCR